MFTSCRQPERSADGENEVSMRPVQLVTRSADGDNVPTWEKCRWQQRDFDGPLVVSYDSRPPECSAERQDTNSPPGGHA